MKKIVKMSTMVKIQLTNILCNALLANEAHRKIYHLWHWKLQTKSFLYSLNTHVIKVSSTFPCIEGKINQRNNEA